MDKKEYEELLEIAKNRAYGSLKHFFELLSIDPKLLEHLFHIEIIIDYDNKFINGCAGYDRGDKDKDNQIAISGRYMNDLLHTNYTRQEAINELATSIVHETLHANRDIIINNGVTHEDIMEEGVQRQSNPHYDMDITPYEKLLIDSIESGIYKIFDKYVPLLITDYGNNNMAVVCYDKQTEEFVFYEKQKFGFDSLENISMVTIGLEVNSPNIEHLVKFRIPAKKKKNESLSDASDYFHQSGIKENYIIEDEPYIRSKTQIALEEAIIEVLSKLIIYNRKYPTLNLKGFKNQIISNPDEITENLIAFEMLNRMGVDTIKWFILSCYQDCYDDKLYNAFKEKYTELLLCFASMRQSTINYEDTREEDIKDSIDIITSVYPKK